MTNNDKKTNDQKSMDLNITGETGNGNSYNVTNISELGSYNPAAQNVTNNNHVTINVAAGSNINIPVSEGTSAAGSQSAPQQSAKKAESDEKTIRHLMQYTNVRLMDEYFNLGPARVRCKVYDIIDCWYAILSASNFIIYDEQLNKLVQNFYGSWRVIVNKAVPFMNLSSNRTDFVFGDVENDYFRSDEEERCFYEILKQWNSLSRKFVDLIAYIKRKYVIDWDDVKI